MPAEQSGHEGMQNGTIGVVAPAWPPPPPPRPPPSPQPVPKYTPPAPAPLLPQLVPLTRVKLVQAPSLRVSPDAQSNS